MNRARVPQIDTGSLQAQLTALDGLERLRSISPSFAEATPETIGLVLDEAAAFAADRLEDVNIASEQTPPVLRDGRVHLSGIHRQVWAEYAAGGWMTLDLPADHGGQGLPLAVAVAAQEIFDRHCSAFGMLPVPVRSAARLIEAWAAPELRDEWLPRLMAGEDGATICISEVGAGSDAPRMRTRAITKGDGTWSVTGEKHWITFGSHDLTGRIGHCLLAQSEEGLSLFLVPSQIDGAHNGVTLRSLERKLGLHGSPTCALGFEDATGYLLGTAGRGLQQMFVMIGNMRLAVGAMGLGMASAAADLALNYARERRQGGRGPEPVPIAEHADVQRMIVTLQSDVELLRGLIYAAAVETDLGRSDADPDCRQESALLTQWLLPIVKTAGADIAFANASTALQVLGGAGYTAEWPIEQLLRDARVLSVFEGTTGIQGLDLLHRRLWKEEGAGLAIFRRRFLAAIERMEARHPEAAVIARRIDRHLGEVTARLDGWRQTPREAEAGATAFLELAIDAGMAWSAARLLALSGEGATNQRLIALALSGLRNLDTRARNHADDAVAGTAPLSAITTL